MQATKALEKQEQTEHDKFRLAQLEWTRHLEKNAKLISSWKFLAILTSCTLLLVVIWAGAKIQQPKLIPYIVEVNGNQISFKGVMQAAPVTITDAFADNYLIRFITNLRSVSTDPVVLRNDLLDLYSISTESAQRQITQWIAGSDPFAKSAKGLRVDVRFTRLTKLGQNTWLVDWVEDTRDQGNLKSSIAWTGTFEYTQQPPKTHAEAEKNPIGFFVTGFNIQRVQS